MRLFTSLEGRVDEGAIQSRVFRRQSRFSRSELFKVLENKFKHMLVSINHLAFILVLKF